MISTETSKFKIALNDILEDLSHHHRNKEELARIYIQSRLNKSLNTYYQSLIKTFEYLDYRNEDNLLRKYKGIIK